MYDYLTVEEFRSGFEDLTELDKKKIMLASISLCKVYRLGRQSISPEELLNEAFQRFLEGSRNLPKNTAFVNSFTYVLKSIAEGMANKIRDSDLSLSNTEWLDERDLLSDSSFEKTIIENERQAERESVLQDVFDYFKDDEGITLLLKAKLEEVKTSNIIKNEFNGDKTKYETTARRYRRGIEKYLSQRETNE